MIVLSVSPPFLNGLINGKIILHSSFSMVKGFWNWVLYQWRPQGCRYIGLDGLKPRHVHNFLTKQHFKMKFWILAILMAIRFHVTILTKFDQIFDQILAKLGQILVKIFKNQKVTYLGSKNAWFQILKNLAHLDQFWNLADIKIWSNGPNFEKFEIRPFWTPNMSIFGFWKFWPKFGQVWPKFGQIWSKWSREI